MKKLTCTLIIFAGLMIGLQAQTMYIHTTGGSTIDVDLNRIEKITFSADDGTTVSDVDGNTYKIVKIGSKWWMAENLKTTKFNDGSSIPLKASDNDWENAGKDQSPAYCWYENNSANKSQYGALYNFFALDPAANGGKNVCPAGWKVPTDADWTTLTDHLGGLSTAGGKMKATGTQYWKDPNTGANNESGFSGLPGGSRVNNQFNQLGQIGRWWSSTTREDNSVWFRQLSNTSASVLRHNLSKHNGFSIRCIKE